MNGYNWGKLIFNGVDAAKEWTMDYFKALEAYSERKILIGDSECRWQHIADSECRWRNVAELERYKTLLRETNEILQNTTSVELKLEKPAKRSQYFFEKILIF